MRHPGVLQGADALGRIWPESRPAAAGLTLFAPSAGFKFLRVTVEPDHQGLEELARLVDGGTLRIQVGHTLPLERARAAHELHPRGKIGLHGVSGTRRGARPVRQWCRGVAGVLRRSSVTKVTGYSWRSSAGCALHSTSAHCVESNSGK